MGLAARGQRETEAGPEPVADPAAAALLRRRARRVHAEALLLAAMATALAFLGRA